MAENEKSESKPRPSCFIIMPISTPASVKTLYSDDLVALIAKVAGLPAPHVLAQAPSAIPTESEPLDSSTGSTARPNGEMNVGRDQHGRLILRHVMPDVRVLIDTLVELGKVQIMLHGGDIARRERISITGVGNSLSLAPSVPKASAPADLSWSLPGLRVEVRLAGVSAMAINATAAAATFNKPVLGYSRVQVPCN